MFLLLPFKGLAVAILFAATSVKALPLNSDGSFDSFFFDPIDLGQTTTNTEPPINIGSTDSFIGSSFPSVGENSNLLAQNFEQPVDLGISNPSFQSINENSNLLAQNFEQPIDFGSVSPSVLPPVDQNSNLLALGQDFQPITPGETFTFPDSGTGFLTTPDSGNGFLTTPDSGNGFLTTPDPNFGLLATGMSCPSGGSFFCCTDQSDENCIPKQNHPFCYDVAHIFCCHNVDPNASNEDLNRKGQGGYQPAGK